MKKTLILPVALSLMFAIGTNTALSAPAQKTYEKPKAMIHKLTDEEKVNFQTREEKRAEWEKLSPEEKNAKMKEMHEKRAADFEAKLGLSEEQKAKAREIREKGREEIKPVFEKMKAKNDEIAAVAKSRITAEAQQEKIEKLQKEMITLKEEADKLRKKNMAEFEKILTSKQKKTLEEMKAEGKKRHEERMKMQGDKGPRGEGPGPKGGMMPPPPPAQD